jgi:TetR/AcrR family transcriptional repressor of nem operon
MLKQSKSDATRQQLLDSGYALLRRKGFAGVGLKEILEVAEIPKGSFYYYFPSKEAFGSALLEQYVDNYLAQLDQLLSAAGQSGRQRLMSYWQAWIRDPETGNSAVDQCLVVKLSAEVADISESMRLVLSQGVGKITQRIAVAIEQGIADGSLPANEVPLITASMLYQLWLGAALLAKLDRHPAALQQALHATERLLSQA